VVLATKSPGFSGDSWTDFCITCEVEGGNGVIHGSLGDGIRQAREQGTIDDARQAVPHEDD
jgi:hypothetical protein